MGFLNKFRPFYTKGLIRMGHKFDGGYIIHDHSLKDAEYLISYGVGYKVDFEEEFYNVTGKPTLAFDPTLYNVSDFIGYIKKREYMHFLRQMKNLILWFNKKKKLSKAKIDFVEEGISATDSEKNTSRWLGTSKNMIFSIKI